MKEINGLTAHGYGNRFEPKEWKGLFMRLVTTVVILTAAFVSGFATVGNAQKVSIHRTDATLEAVMDDLRRQTGYGFTVDAAVKERAGRVSIDRDDAELREVMDELVGALGLRYTIPEGRKFIIIEERVAAPSAGIRSDAINRVSERAPSQPPLRIRITDKEGNPLDGATIIHKPSKKSTMTDKAGQATVVAQVGDELDVRFIGYKRETVQVESLNQPLVLALETEESFLDEAVVTSYENTTRRNTVGNISSIDMKKIPVQNTSNSLAMLQGLAPGLDIQISGGGLGQASKVRVQGDQSLLFSAPPLYVIDGMMVSEYTTNTVTNNSRSGWGVIPTIPGNAPLGGGVAGGTQSSRGNFIDFLDFNNIESITVLKDADAVSIYGSRAANGAIVIKTKRATTNGLSIRANTNLQWQPRRLELMNTKEYLQMRQLAIKNSNPPNTIGEAYHDINLFDPNEDNDWQDIVMGHSVMNYSLGFTLSSVQRSSSNRLSFDFRPNRHFYDSESKYNSYSLSNSLDLGLFNDKINISNVTSMGYIASNQMAQDFTLFSLTTAPNFPKQVWDSKEDVLWEYGNSLLFSRPDNHPLYRSAFRLDQETLTLANSLNLKASLASYLDADFVYGVANTRAGDDFITRYNGRARELYGTLANNGSFIQKNFGSWRHNLDAFATLKDTKVFGVVSLANISGVNYSTSRNDAYQYQFNGNPLDEYVGNVAFYTGDVSNPLSDRVFYRYFALYNRMTARYSNLMMNINYRYDGSSRFAPESRWSSFYSVAFGWNLSDERWFTLPDLFVKPRVSFGTVGNDNIPDYGYMQRFSQTGSINYPNNGIVREQNLYAKKYKWEDFRKLNAGLDVIYRDFSAIIDYSLSTSRDQLIQYRLPDYLGQNSVLQNFPGVFQTRSLELNLSYRFKLSRNNQLIVNALFTKPKDKLVSFPDLDKSSYANFLVEGKSKSMFQYPKLLGVDAVSGLYHYEHGTLAGQTTTNINQAARQLIETPVNHYGSLLLTFKGKKLSASASLYFRSEKNLASRDFDYSLVGSSGAPGNGMNNYRFLLYENFDAKAESAEYQKFITNYSQMPYGSLDNIDLYFLRLNNVNVSYTFDKLLLGSTVMLSGYASNIPLKTNSQRLNYEGNNNFLPILMDTGIQLTVNF